MAGGHDGIGVIGWFDGFQAMGSGSAKQVPSRSGCYCLVLDTFSGPIITGNPRRGQMMPRPARIGVPV